MRCQMRERPAAFAFRLKRVDEEAKRREGDIFTSVHTFSETERDRIDNKSFHRMKCRLSGSRCGYIISITVVVIIIITIKLTFY